MLVSTATLLVLTVWFSTNAIAPALEATRGYSSSDIAWLTIGVQVGFVIGIVIISLTNLADVMNTRILFAVSATLAAAANVALVFAPDGLAAALAIRVLSGVFLGGVYPPGMEIISGWFRSGRGIAIGGMIAALTLGSGSLPTSSGRFSSPSASLRSTSAPPYRSWAARWCTFRSGMDPTTCARRASIRDIS